MRILGLIPARMGSSRFPGKPLASIAGVAMIQRVYNACASCSELTDLYVATCDDEIAVSVAGFGGKVVMTRSDHQRASDRCAEALERLEKDGGSSFDIVVMIQGDEPLINGEMISAAIKPLKDDPAINVVNLINKILHTTELNDPNCIKVAFSNDYFALYFSRLPIPFSADASTFTYYKQVCIIPFRRDYLKTYLQLPPTPLEEQESIDMLRILEHGDRVKLVPTDVLTHAVDCPQDVDLVESLLAAEKQIKH